MADSTQTLPHIQRSLEHGRHFRELGMTIGCWVRLADGRYGTVHTYPGGDEAGKVSVGIDGNQQFGGKGVNASVSIYELLVCDLPDLADRQAVAEWLDA